MHIWSRPKSKVKAMKSEHEPGKDSSSKLVFSHLTRIRIPWSKPPLTQLSDQTMLLGLVRSSGAGVDVKLMVGSAICPHAFAYLFLDMATLEVSELLELITQLSCISSRCFQPLRFSFFSPVSDPTDKI